MNLKTKTFFKRNFRCFKNMQTYKISFWKNYGIIFALSLFIFVFGFGLIMYLAGIALLIIGIVGFSGVNPELDTLSGYMGLVGGLILSYSGYLCLWAFFSSYKANVSFTDKEIILRTPRKTIFFLFPYFPSKEKIIPYSAIKGIFFGSYIMEKVYPADAKLVPRQYLDKQRLSGLEVYVEKNGKQKRVDLPIFHKYPEYYAALRKLVSDIGLHQTEAKCLFIK